MNRSKHESRISTAVSDNSYHLPLIARVNDLDGHKGKKNTKIKHFSNAYLMVNINVIQ